MIPCLTQCLSRMEAEVENSRMGIFSMLVWELQERDTTFLLPFTNSENFAILILFELSKIDKRLQTPSH